MGIFRDVACARKKISESGESAVWDTDKVKNRTRTPASIGGRFELRFF
jgi:hypothetical protein